MEGFERKVIHSITINNKIHRRVVLLEKVLLFWTVLECGIQKVYFFGSNLFSGSWIEAYHALMANRQLIVKGRSINTYTGSNCNKNYYANGMLIWNRGFTKAVKLWFDEYRIDVPESIIQFLAKLESTKETKAQKE